MYLSLREAAPKSRSGDEAGDQRREQPSRTVEPAATCGATGRPARCRQRVTGTVVGLGLVSLLTDISSESVSAILPLYYSYLGLSMVAYGFLDGLYQGVSAVTRIAAGAASDRYDRPKWVAAGGYAFSAVARVGLLSFNGLGLLAAVITADRIGKGIRTAPRDAMIAASSTAANLGRSFGVHRAMDTAGAAIGPLVAFAILWAVPTGFDLVFAVSLACAALGVAVLALGIRSVRPRREASLSSARSRFTVREILTPQLKRVVVVAAVLSLVTVGDGFLYLALMERSDFGTRWFPMLFVGTNLAYMALALPMGLLADRVGRVRVFVGGHVFLLLAYVGAVVPVAGWFPTVTTVLLLGGFYAATDGILAAVAGRTVPVDGRASGIAVAQTAVALARLVSSTVFGLLWFLVGPTVALLLVGGLLAVLLAPSYLLLRSLREVAQ